MQGSATRCGVQGGGLCAIWRAPVAVVTRDWLQAGVTLTLMRTSLELPDQVHPRLAF